MRCSTVLLATTSLVSYAHAQADTVAYTDAETGITFQSYTDTNTNVSWRVALPENTDGSYDTLLQIEGPATLGWIGFAWGGTMAYNPLTVIWANGNNIIHSSREASGYYSPAVYNGTTYKVLKGTGVSNGNLKFTAVCTGCSAWKDYDGNPQSIDLSQSTTRLAFALSQSPVNVPADSSSSFDVHDGVGHYYADLGAAKSADFNTWVAKNAVSGGNATVPPSNNTTSFRRGRLVGDMKPLIQRRLA